MLVWYSSADHVVRHVLGAAGQVAEGVGVLQEAVAQRGGAAGAAAQHVPGAPRGAGAAPRQELFRRYVLFPLI